MAGRSGSGCGFVGRLIAMEKELVVVIGGVDSGDNHICAGNPAVSGCGQRGDGRWGRHSGGVDGFFASPDADGARGVLSPDFDRCPRSYPQILWKSV